MKEQRRGTGAGIRVSAVALAVSALFAAQPGLAYDEAPVSNGATIEGEVSYSARVPTRKIIPNDPDVCGGPRDIALIETIEGGRVTDAVVYLEGVDKGKPWPEQTAVPRLDNVDCRFRPQIVVMPPGPVEIHNSDPVLHNTHSFYGGRTAFNIALPNQGQSIEKALRRPGILRVECDAHGHMSARIFVAANPYYAATQDGGTFHIDEVPPGEYKLVAYQEEVGPVETTISVKPGETVKLAVDLAEKAIERR
ncbi:MAG: hypothetical protein MUC77_12700 [Chromatiaceae bacterium]|jgi:hypothetical protein|nr:hypothetical protein [Chromatiaceae bacterium]